ncbi:MAG TPA: hypothetical protein PLS49_00055 [Candidatus Woesebacteria bacterium]|nr:hypothetical protein [Candidatus Woesebacteria bacterium]
MKKTNKLLNRKFMEWLVFPFMLVFFWFVATFIYTSLYNGSYTVISVNHDVKVFTNIPDGKILKGEKLTGEFEAKNDNLGIVAIRFKQQQRIAWKQEDILIFRLKEKGSPEWIYENHYYSGLTYDVPFLPIGFPVIDDSKDKTYVFEFESTKGNLVNGLVLGSKNPIFASRYQMNKSELLADTSLLIKFFYTKIVNTFDTPDILYSSLIYLFPFFLYIAWVSGILKKIFKLLFNDYKRSRVKKILSVLYGYNTSLGVMFSIFVVVAVLYDIFILQVLNDMVYIVLIGIWICLQKLVQSTTIITFVVAFIFIFITLLLNELGSITAAEKSGAWAFMFLLGGIILELIYLRKSGK